MMKQSNPVYALVPIIAIVSVFAIGLLVKAVTPKEQLAKWEAENAVQSSPQSKTSAQGQLDLFGVPAGFHRQFVLKYDHDSSLGTKCTRRSVRISVPLGLTDSALEQNMRAAAEDAYERDHHPHAIVIFSNKPNTPEVSDYTAGRLYWAPHGEWIKADENVSVEEHGILADVSTHYREKAAPPHVDSDIDKWEKKREVKLNRRFSAARRRKMYYEITKAMYTVDPSYPGGGDASIKANMARVCSRLHISEDDADVIRTEGDTVPWPEYQITAKF